VGLRGTPIARPSETKGAHPLRERPFDAGALLIALLPLVAGLPRAGGMQRLKVGLRLELQDPRDLLGLRAQRPRGTRPAVAL